ncbi:MAG: metallophosphoesterase family protein, partial [Chitinophagaceae bacterium]
TKTEEKNNLLDCWPTAPLGNFTMNSNHEMYDGANGLFNIALGSPLFAAQKSTTYFQIAFGNWLIIALDSAYFDTSVMFMDGAITDAWQKNFLNQAGASGKKICILTHHNPLSTNGKKKLALWNQVVNALGKNPDYWYWGHVHNGMVYTPQSAGGGVNCRCLGNAAIPIGDAAWLKNNPAVSFYTNKPLVNTTPQQQLRVLNGFAMLQFSNNAVSEKWYYQDGSQAWSS